MKQVIWKFPLELVAEQDVEMPEDGRVLTIQTQGETLTLWALVDQTNKLAKRRIRLHGTGHPFAGHQGVYLATVQNGPFVWHFFDMGWL